VKEQWHEGLMRQRDESEYQEKRYRGQQQWENTIATKKGDRPEENKKDGSERGKVIGGFQ